MDKYITGTGQHLHVHTLADCDGEKTRMTLHRHPCVIHNPSFHHMNGWPTNWRADRGIMERICPHGVGHPDPDDMAYQRRTYMGGRHPEYIDGVHGCDGCCAKEK